ncbi:molybdopterin-dependent oxidoreductase [Rhizobium alvei]|uniref:Molybdopterin-dependent oxidoreductase n=1 Tax=Rhizobium alvei TaxID=1132659 RepID=A0ABT8YRT9_9HYPH|nr:molybdopterin-dependent oxidoreductase [Rhizobium alvei]MDO6966356.1 molybdopterin-dependent oxidoreductase [Rhizobium alvei]
MNIRNGILAAALLILNATTAVALEKPTGDVVLTVTGKISQPNAGDKAEFDIDMLEKLVSRTGTMETPWTTGKVTFSGPMLNAILEAAGADGETLTIKALNDYAADVPMSDAKDFDTILATRMDGKLMSVRDKGPLFLIYPFDEKPELYNEKYFSRSVWQIKAIEVH